VVAPQPASPPARRLHHPSWLDLRLIVGILLVLISVLVGAKVMANADRSVQVWALARDVAAGTTLVADDLRPARVRLFDNGAAYLQAVQSPTGRTVTRDMRAGELLPRLAVGATEPAAIVSIPVQAGNAPALARGALIDVWSTVKGCVPVQVLSRVVVQDVRSGAGGALSVNPASIQVIVRVTPEQARRVVAALGTESTIRLVVLEGDLPPAPVPTASVETCGPAGGGRGQYEPGRTSEQAAGRVRARSSTVAGSDVAGPETAGPETAGPETAPSPSATSSGGSR
jgi:SAF domain